MPDNDWIGCPSLNVTLAIKILNLHLCRIFAATKNFVHYRRILSGSLFVKCSPRQARVYFLIDVRFNFAFEFEVEGAHGLLGADLAETLVLDHDEGLVVLGPFG